MKTTCIYETAFNLTSDVNDLEAAQDYLNDPNMTEYLVEEYPKLNGVVNKIEWILKNYSDGVIKVRTTRELTEEEKEIISEWIKGQNSDGLGEGFEQQDFARLEEDESDWDNEYYDDYHEYSDIIYASFDWQTNKYILKLVSKYEY